MTAKNNSFVESNSVSKQMAPFTGATKLFFIMRTNNLTYSESSKNRVFFGLGQNDGFVFSV